jgi:Predicted xylanase/chitin deacetylase
MNVRLRGIGRLQRLSRRVRRWGLPRALILLYHRVGDVHPDPHSLMVSARHFQEQLDVLCAQARPMHLTELVQRMAEGTLPDRSVAVTFDDGYADNLTLARPLLQRYSVPASVFVATGTLTGQREFWWDELAQMLLSPGTLPSRLVFHIRRQMSEWAVGASEYSVEAFNRHRSWKVSDEWTPSRRHDLYRSLCVQLRPLPDQEREAVLREIRMQTGTPAAVRPSHRTLRPEELIELTDGGLVDVGAHSVTHPVLGGLPQSAQEHEIRHSKQRLEEILGRQVKSFTYPHGGLFDFSSTTVAAVRDAGFAYACSASAGLVFRDVSLHLLPRMFVRNWDGEEFAERLESWFDERPAVVYSQWSSSPRGRRIAL